MASNPNDPCGARRLTGLAIEKQCLELRIGRLSYGQIAQRLGIPKTTVRDATKRGLTRERAEVDHLADAVREAELMSLDFMESTLFDSIAAGDLNSIGMALRIKERRAKLLGLDAPARTAGTLDANISGTHGVEFMTREVMDETIRRKLAELRQANIDQGLTQVGN